MNRTQFLSRLLRKQNTVPVEEGGGQECFICKEEYGHPSSGTETAETQVRLPCSDKHTVGANCIFQWLQSHNTCPVCRHQFFPKERNKVDRGEASLIDLMDDEDVENGESDLEDEDFVDEDEGTDEEDVNMSDADEGGSDEESDGGEEV